MNQNQPQIEPVLLDVRRSYRLLHDYQRMVLDAVGYIGAQLDIPYNGGWPRFGDSGPRAGYGQPTNCAWDWLSMVSYEFHFLKDLSDTENPGNEELLSLSVLVISDSGYFYGIDETTAKSDVSAFALPEQSSTKIGFIFRRGHCDPLEFTANKSEMRRFMETEGELPAELVAKNFVGKCCDLARITSEDETNALIDEIVSLARMANLPLERIKKAQ